MFHYFKERMKKMYFSILRKEKVTRHFLLYEKGEIIDFFYSKEREEYMSFSFLTKDTMFPLFLGLGRYIYKKRFL